MKRILLLLSLLGLVISSCEDKTLQTYMANVPVYMSYEDLRASFKVSNEQALEKPGKIYFKDSYMYINEYQKGIHVVDLSDPENPVKKSFIEIPGNVDMSIRNDVLYAESYVDLVLIDVSDPTQPIFIKRIEDIFEYVIPSYDYEYPLDEIDQDKGVITAFELKKITREVDHNPYPWPIYYDYAMESSFMGSPKVNGAGNSFGIGGSMARFITYDDYLYALESTYKLKCIDISNPDQVEVKNEQYLWGNVETVFIADQYMYVGTSNGMHILSLEVPSSPNQLSSYQHITSCDPVVVEGDWAYVTLRSGNLCGGNQNLLEVINIADKTDPKREASFGMKSPYGVGIDNGILFVCEGEYGLRIFDATDVHNIVQNQIASFPGIHAYDVIPLGTFLLLIGDDGFHIYDYSNLEDIHLLGSIPVMAVED
ncbi:MAG: hypothetical protein E4H10_01635 [Bacteroidia bacterium]|nr:MAG: hypothetical protein E4H10_01635 [Bacteroidia bacterium]